MTDVEARFEFRVWGMELDDAVGRLRNLADSGEQVLSNETYLVVLDRDDVNTKIRDHVLDIKVLKASSQGCEQWHPETKAEFPLPGVLLAEEILPRLGIADPVLNRESYTEAEFLEEVVRPHSRVLIAEVSKRRLKYTIGGCFAELADVTLDDHELRTVAVESEDLDALCEVRDRLGLGQYENVSYPQAIKVALGWAIS
jgi:exopolyphosphatase/guanosine-5'-triphosphate,3'-diphosphate pyrophosphatase